MGTEVKNATFRPARHARTLALVAIFAVLMVVIHTTHLRVVKLSGGGGASADATPLIPPPATVKLLTLGYDQLVADCWWLAFIQYYGDQKERAKDHSRWSYRYLDLVTTLDPRFTQPYWFAAFAVGAEMKRPDLATGLIDRGLRANQDNWYLPFIAGINQYLFGSNDAQAAKYYRLAATYPNAPEWLGRQAKILESKMPSMLKEIKTWTMIYQSAREPLVRETARQNLVARWVRIYKQAPAGNLWKVRAVEELKALGVVIQNRN